MSKYNVLKITPVSVTIEMINDDPYYQKTNFDVFVNDELKFKDLNKNVFTIFDLNPNTSYRIKILGEEINVKTLAVNKIVNIDDCGAINDGVFDNTDIIQDVINKSNNDLIVFKSGTYFTRPLDIKSNTYIYIKKDATLLGSPLRKDYPSINLIEYKDGKEYVNGTWEGVPRNVHKSLIHICDCKNIMIIGDGTINGNADKGDWWINPKKIINNTCMGNNIFINRSKNIDVIGLNVLNSPTWNIHPFYSENLSFINLYVKSRYDSPNTDGINPESCKNIDIIGNRICVGDDCVALKSGKKMMADKFFKPCENITIRNCFMGDGHGAIVFGSESSCGIKNVVVEKCLFSNTDRGFRIKTKRNRGNKATVENISFNNIYMDHVKSCLVINMYYFLSHNNPNSIEYSKDYVTPNENTPHLGSFVFKNMKCLNTKACAGYFYGLPESMIDNITLENIEVTYDSSYKDKDNPIMMPDCEKLNKGGFYFFNVDKINIINVSVDGQNGEVFNMNNCNEFLKGGKNEL